MTLQRLKWLSILAAFGFIAILEYVRASLDESLLSLPGRLLMDGVVLTGVFFFLGAVFSMISRMQQRLERQNRELLALHEAALDIYVELSLDAVLQKVVDQARQLVDARYGALSVVSEGSERLESFVTSGLDSETAHRIGPGPEGLGLLGVVLHGRQRLRLSDLADDARSIGFPAHHPAMSSLLAVPIVCRSPLRGSLYLAQKTTAPEFSAEDEETLARFATKAAIAIDNAHLHERLNTLAVAEERLRIAREMHDGLAQVLAYVNTKAQAVTEYLESGHPEEASNQLEQLARAAREVYADVREGILGLRASSGPQRSLEESLHEYVGSWQDQSGISCELSVEPNLRLSPGVELQLLRIVQEALSNVRKHARAKRAEVRLQRVGERVVVNVEDDGVGFNPAVLGRSRFPRFGLATMRERAESIGGTVDLETAPGEGTVVMVELPVQVGAERLEETVDRAAASRS